MTFRKIFLTTNKQQKAIAGSVPRQKSPENDLNNSRKLRQSSEKQILVQGTFEQLLLFVLTSSMALEKWIDWHFQKL